MVNVPFPASSTQVKYEPDEVYPPPISRKLPAAPPVHVTVRGCEGSIVDSEDLLEITGWPETVTVALNAPTSFPPVPLIVYAPSGMSGPAAEALSAALY